jgi:glycerate 2-kinase
MKIVVACDKYKGSLSAYEVCSIIASSIKDIDSTIEVIINPMADGGEGTVETLVESLKGRYVEMKATGPLGDNIDSRFGIIHNNIAVIEMSAASGLWLVPYDRRNPMETTTYGTGELLRKAVEMGCSKVIMGLGGSSTNDGGMGMAQALGVRFYDIKGNLLGLGGSQLSKISRIDMSGLDPDVLNVVYECACDVENPLTGKNGAAYIYAGQKGADSNMIKELNRGLINFSKIVKKDIGKNIRDLKGAGASGGLGGGMVAFLNARLRIGVNIIIDVTKLEEKIKNADLIITGEGAFDRQTFFGKSAYGVANLAKKYNIPVITINGSVLMDRKSVGHNESSLFAGNFSILNKPMDLSDAIENSSVLLENTIKEIMNFFLKIKRK